MFWSVLFTSGENTGVEGRKEVSEILALLYFQLVLKTLFVQRTILTFLFTFCSLSIYLVE